MKKKIKKGSIKLKNLTERVYEEEIEYMCPKRGLVKQIVKITKLKPRLAQSPINLSKVRDAALMPYIDNKEDK